MPVFVKIIADFKNDCNKIKLYVSKPLTSFPFNFVNIFGDLSQASGLSLAQLSNNELLDLTCELW